MTTAKWLDREALVTVKAYPTPSTKYIETTCVAAITREEGWVRLYPLGFRALPREQQFHKFQCIRLRMRKHPHSRDTRPESYRPDEHSIQLGKIVDTKDDWRRRWEWIRPTIGPSMCELQQLQRTEGRSLGCVRPREVDDLTIEETGSEWSGRKQSVVDQMVLFDPVESKLEKMPFNVRYRYRCESPDCGGHTQIILDWELVEFYRRMRKQGVPTEDIPREIRKKFLDEICGAEKDTHFFVGSHSRFPASFMVLGEFWPRKSDSLSLF